jgi:ribonuclease Z
MGAPDATTPDGYPLPMTNTPITKDPIVGSGRHYPAVFRPGEALAEDEIRLTCCGSGNPIVRRGQAATSWLVEIGTGDKLIFDVGGGSVQNLWSLVIPPEHLNKLFLTHLHLDHVGDFHVLYDAMVWGREATLRVWGPSGYTAEMGTAAFVDHMVKAARWHNESKIGIGPSGGMRTEVSEFDVGSLSPENPQVLVYEENGVRVWAFPVVHCIYGAVGYRLEWNGLSLSFHGDGTPNGFEAEQAAGVDLFMHEAFVDPATFSDNADIPLQVTEAIVSEHTTGDRFGELCQIVRPRMAVAYHYFVNANTIDPFFSRLRSTWDGPLVLAQDLTVINLSAEQITVRQAETDALHWPPPAPPDKASPVMEDYSEAQIPEWLVATTFTDGER